MPESWFSLSRKDQAEALEVAAASTGRPPHLLEKDIWVVWTLSAIYQSSFADKLTFKGGTSLSKVFRIIERFSEDVDLTYDIREVVPDLLRNGNPIPASSSQAKKIKIILTYTPTKQGTGYAASTIQLEFGARATGEPHQQYAVACDIAALFTNIRFPTALPLVMSAERTFWEKATAAHVYCRQGRMRGHRYSRHWYDLAAMCLSGHADKAITDQQLAKTVAQHKSMFFAEKDLRRDHHDLFRATEKHQHPMQV